jgi:hypothetical protein
VKENLFDPTKDTKSFTGKVFSEEDWKQFIKDNIENEKSILNELTTIQVSSVKDIYQEIRFWVIGGKVVTGSRYKLGANIEYSEYFDCRSIRISRKW